MAQVTRAQTGIFNREHYKMQKGPTPKTQAWAQLITFFQEPAGSAKWPADNILTTCYSSTTAIAETLTGSIPSAPSSGGSI